MLISVAVCTWNRANALRQTLQAMTELSIPPGLGWELLVINNNCSDHTDEVIASFSKRLPIRRLFEPKPGLSNARNCAVRHAAGDYMLWTDDDVIVDRGWIAAYHKAFLKWPDTAVFGGPIRPIFEGTPPDWIETVALEDPGMFVLRDFGTDEIPLTAGTLPYGANYAVRSREQKLFFYDPNLGTTETHIVCGEELAVLCAILHRGGTARWVPEAKVQHFVLKEKQTVEWVKKRSFASGVYAACKYSGASAPGFLGRPWRLWIMAASRLSKYVVARLLFPPKVWVRHAVRLSWMWGRLRIGEIRRDEPVPEIPQETAAD